LKPFIAYQDVDIETDSGTIYGLKNGGWTSIPSTTTFHWDPFFPQNSREIAVGDGDDLLAQMQDVVTSLFNWSFQRYADVAATISVTDTSSGQNSYQWPLTGYVKSLGAPFVVPATRSDPANTTGQPFLLLHWGGWSPQAERWFLIWWELIRDQADDPNVSSISLTLDDLPGWKAANGVAGFEVLFGSVNPYYWKNDRGDAYGMNVPNGWWDPVKHP
jgi:hypothetical protein